MRFTRLLIGLAWLIVAPLQAGEAGLQQQYAQVQDLNNQAYLLIHAGPPDAAGLNKAADLARQGLGVLDRMQSQVDDAVWLGGRMQDRRYDLSIRLAEALALEGKRDAALDALEALFAGDAWASSSERLAKDPALRSLHDEPRFRALLARLQRLGHRWNASAITGARAPLDEASRIAGLSLFWSEARYNFVHFDHVPELDWNGAYLDFLPKVAAAKSLHDYYDALMRFAALLHDGHTDISPPPLLANEFFAAPPLETALIEGRVLVTRLQSPALAAAGVHVGDEILTVDGQPVHDYAQAHVSPYVAGATPQDRAVRMYGYQLLDGDHRDPVVLGLRDAAGRQRQVRLSREKDPQRVPSRPFEWRMLKGGIAYLAINEFADEAGLKAFERELPNILKARGLVLDVRRNGGGSTNVGLKLLSYLDRKPIPRAKSRSLQYVPAYRAWSGPYVQWRKLGSSEGYSIESPRHYDGPVALLIGPRTFSAGEDFAMSFQAMKRGVLVGAPTGGSTGQPLVFSLPGGGTARICAKQDSYPDGREFVGVGIKPDITVVPAVDDIRHGRDPVLERAVAELGAAAGSTHLGPPAGRLQNVEYPDQRQDGDDEQDDEDHEQHLGDRGRDTRDPAETEPTGYQRDDGEDNDPLEHAASPSAARSVANASDQATPSRFRRSSVKSPHQLAVHGVRLPLARRRSSSPSAAGRGWGEGPHLAGNPQGRGSKAWSPPL